MSEAMMTKALAPPPALSGPERAAIVLRELGEEVAVVVMRQMDEATIARITTAMSRLNRVTPDIRESVISDFEADLGVGDLGDDALIYITRVLMSALGEVRAQEIVGRLRRDGRSEPGSRFTADPRTLAIQMAGERPQTLALLLAQLPHDTGAAMLSFLPESVATEAIYRFTTLDAVSPEAVRELSEMLAELNANSEDRGRRLTNLGGAKQAADILNHLQIGLSERVMEAIESQDQATAEKIRENLFTFQDLSRLSNRTLQILLREVPSTLLAPALRLVDDSVRARFFQNMSVRMAEILQEELRSGPPMRRSDVLAAQSEIVEAALRLAAEGRIAISATEEMV
jgi:flagellar motor switch protein FliG